MIRPVLIIVSGNSVKVKFEATLHYTGTRYQYSTMGVERTVLKSGNEVDKPQKGDLVTIEYTGNLYDDSAPEKKGTQYGPYHQLYPSIAVRDTDACHHRFDTSKGRGDFQTEIGVGKVIRGWDEGVTQMSLGEKSILTISG